MTEENVFRKNKMRKCRLCMNAAIVARRQRIAAAKAARQRKTDEPNYYQDKGLQRRYGIRRSDYLAMVEAQGGLCAICRGAGKPAKRMRPNALCVDHDHRTGKIRGLLCHDCNVGLARIEDPTFAAAAITYLVLHGSR